MELEQINRVVQKGRTAINHQASRLYIRDRNRLMEIKGFVCNVDMASRFISSYNYIDLCEMLATYIGGSPDSFHFSDWEKAIDMIPDFGYNFSRCVLADETGLAFRDLLKQIFATDIASRTPEDTINRINFLNHLLILNSSAAEYNNLFENISMSDYDKSFLTIVPELIDAKIVEYEKTENLYNMINELMKNRNIKSGETNDDYRKRLESIAMVKTPTRG
jgi:hypothetical protein